MTNDSIFAPGFFELRELNGLGALDARQLADIGVTLIEGGQLRQDGRAVAEPKQQGQILRWIDSMARIFAAATPSHA